MTKFFRIAFMISLFTSGSVDAATGCGAFTEVREIVYGKRLKTAALLMESAQGGYGTFLREISGMGLFVGSASRVVPERSLVWLAVSSTFPPSNKPIIIILEILNA